MKTLLAAALLAAASASSEARAAVVATLAATPQCQAREAFSESFTSRSVEFVACLDASGVVKGISYRNAATSGGDWRWIGQEELLSVGYVAIHSDSRLEVFSIDKVKGGQLDRQVIDLNQSDGSIYVAYSSELERIAMLARTVASHRRASAAAAGLAEKLEK